MSEAAFVVLVIASPLLGGAMRRWLALLLPVIGWPIFYIGPIATGGAREPEMAGRA